jgi:hypothetical protein
VSERRLKRILDSTPADREAEDRAWQVVRAAYAEREPVPRRVPRLALALAVAAIAVTAAVVSPQGRAVVDAVRRTIGVEHAAPALFRLPADGRLLVSGEGGAWIVDADGSKRRLGDYAHASWSPHALFVIASGANELAALEPAGDVHWSLARPGVAHVSWGGSRTDTRIAYLSDGRLRIVGGNGTGDRALPLRVGDVPPVWRPGNVRQLALVGPRGNVVLYDVDRSSAVWTSAAYPRPRALAWMDDGTELALATATHLVLLRPADGQARSFPIAGIRALAFSSGRLALLRGNSVALFDGGATPRQLFAAPARPSGLAWSPDGRWLATTLPAADQWVFVQARGGRRVLAVSRIRSQLGGAVSLDGWAPAQLDGWASGP